MRLPLLPTAALSAVLLAACGGGGAAAPAPPPVRLVVTAPADQAVVHQSSVELQGTVRPSSAAVTVAGRRAAVSGGTFRGSVALAPGTNVIDVLASAGQARPSLVAIRVRREISVRVPELTGLSASDARRQLSALGLKADVKQDGGLFDRLLAGDPRVCATDPATGAQLDPGATVQVLVARRC